MTTTNKLLDQYQRKHKITTSTDLAASLGIKGATISRYRQGRTMDANIAKRICRDLNLDFEYFVAKLEADRSISKDKKNIWNAVAKRIAGTAAALPLVILIASNNHIFYTAWQFILCKIIKYKKKLKYWLFRPKYQEVC